MVDKNYSHVATIYDYLMRDINYSDWAEYLNTLFENYGNCGYKILEIACGTGKLANSMKKYFSNIFISDLSINMLEFSNAKNKVCCDMRYLPFQNHFDFIYSTFDSVNYLLTTEDLQKHFLEIEKILSEDGIYTFDVSLEPNSINNIEQLNRIKTFENYSFQQISSFDRTKKLHTNKFLFFKDGSQIAEEIHLQSIYNLDIYFDIIDKTNMFVVECFDSFSFKDVSLNSERAQFIIKKIKNA